MFPCRFFCCLLPAACQSDFVESVPTWIFILGTWNFAYMLQMWSSTKSYAGYGCIHTFCRMYIFTFKKYIWTPARSILHIYPWIWYHFAPLCMAKIMQSKFYYFLHFTKCTYLAMNLGSVCPKTLFKGELSWKNFIIEKWGK